MAGSFSDYLEDELLDHVFSAATFTAPSTTYIGLWTSALTDASTGGTAGEVSGGSYARVNFANDATNWPAASGGAKSNGTAITFAQATADWGTVTHVAVLDTSTAAAGNILAWADLTVSKQVGTNDTAEFAVGDFDVTLD